MATKQAVNKSQAVIGNLNAHARAFPSEVQSSRATAPLPKPANPLTLDQIKMLAQAIKRIRLRDSLHTSAKSGTPIGMT